MMKELQSFGLSEKEAKVYLAALEIGRATADQLSKQAGVNRSTTYVQIEELMSMGLVSTHEEGKKTYFHAESPENLKRIFESKKQEFALKEKTLDALVPSLLKLYQSSGERPVVRFFEGKEGLVTMRNEVLKVKGKHYLLVVAHDHMQEVFTQKERDDFSRIRGSKGIGGKVIYTKSGEDIEPVPPIEMCRVGADQFPLETDLYIYDDTVSLASLTGSIAGVIIESPAIAKSMRSIFELAWKAAEKPQNKSKNNKK